MVERNLAKVEVASSSLVSRSSLHCEIPGKLSGLLVLAVSQVRARWQNGHAAACKAVYAGSIPTLASISSIESLRALVAKLVDATDLKSVGPKGPCWFKSSPGHHAAC